MAGEENLDFVESLRKSKIKLVVTRHEMGAGMMAATVGRLTGDMMHDSMNLWYPCPHSPVRLFNCIQGSCPSLHGKPCLALCEGNRPASICSMLQGHASLA